MAEAGGCWQPWVMRKRTWLALGATAVGAAGHLAARRAVDRWADAGAEPEPFPAGDDLVVVTDDGAILRGTIAGEGPPVVLAHGWTEDRTVWAPVARRLVSAGRTVIAWDQRGHGRSTAGAEGWDVHRLGRDLAAVLAEVDARGAVVAGHSMGGMTAMAWASDDPAAAAERAVGLVLVATAAGGLGRPPRWAGALVASGAVARLARGRRTGPLLFRRTVGRTVRLADLRVAADAFAAASPAARKGFLEVVGDLDLDRRLDRITLPTWVLAGSEDRLTPPALGARIAAAIDGARYIELPGRGHMLPLEAPDDVVAAVLEASSPPLVATG